MLQRLAALPPDLQNRPTEPIAPERGRRSDLLGRLFALLDVVALGALTLAVGYWCGALRGFPKGTDALLHITKLKLLQEAWPHINWNDQWHGGLPNFTGSYPPGYHLLLVAVTHVHHTSDPTALLVVAGLSLVLVIAGSYGFVRVATGSRTLAWLAALVILGQPTLWSQVLEFGLYPRLLSMGCGAAALPFAVLFGRKPTQLRGATMVFFLAAALSAHPFIGVVMTVFAAGAVILVSEGRMYLARARNLVLPMILLFLLVAYFYVPEFLIHQGQTAAQFVNTVPFPVPWIDLVWARATQFDGPLISWSPVTLPLLVGAVGAALLGLRRPSARVDPVGLRRHPDATAEALDRFLVELEAAAERRRRYKPTLGLALWSGLIAFLFFAYCMLAHFVSTFPYYVNGLYPNALTLYTAYFLVLGSALALAPAARRLGPLLLLVGAGAAALLLMFLPNRAQDANNVDQHLIQSMVTAHIPQQHLYRIADASTDVANFLNYYTRTPQTFGYQPEGDLHPAWQIWLQDAILDINQQTEADRKFLFDWYAVKWVIVHDNSEFQPFPHDYRLVAQKTQILPTTIWAVRNPTPMFTATNTPPLLFIGDAPHYDIFLHTLGAADIDSRKLLVVDGGPSLDKYSSAELATYGEVILWDSAQSGSGAALLDAYVKAGGRAFVDEGETKPLLPFPDDPVGTFLKGTLTGAWGFKDDDPSYLAPSLLHRLPPPDYAGTGSWQITYPRQLPTQMHVLARTTGGRVVLAEKNDGSGTIIWSGLNLPYLASATHSRDAIRLLLELMTGTTSPLVASIGSTAEWVNPEHWEFIVPAGTTSVLLREYTNLDWHATNATTGAALPINVAGPGMTLISVPASSGNTTIELTYQLSSIEKVSIWISAAGLLLLLLYALGVPFPFLL